MRNVLQRIARTERFSGIGIFYEHQQLMKPSLQCSSLAVSNQSSTNGLKSSRSLGHALGILSTKPKCTEGINACTATKGPLNTDVMPFPRSPACPNANSPSAVCTVTLHEHPAPNLLHLPFILLRVTVVFTLYTDRPCLSTLYCVVNDHRSQFSAIDAPRIETFAVIVKLEAATGVMSVDNG